ncbi:MAG: hypothetical protein KGJ89_04105 [Patescibacteria group bacterium]|nr:hypothetical protein [Patescibacteria group bacterium]MDE2015309.1 hypothetical protein [Patescibacteria group bacterium]MDE2227114.1 hypothetical protein [Patescibacteria group bacterium]
MKEIFHRHRSLWVQKSFLVGVIMGILMLVAGISATYYANFYTTIHASNSVTDIILDNIPTINVDFVFSEGASIFVAIFIAVILYEPKRMPFALKAAAMFFVTRSFFMILTHIAPPTHGSYVDPTDLIYKLSSGDDLFFSAHTGFPFLLALTFWDERYLRALFLVATAIGGAAVLLGHLHYSIDVFSALFISFGVYYAAKNFFSSDYALLKSQ